MQGLEPLGGILCGLLRAWHSWDVRGRLSEEWLPCGEPSVPGLRHNPENQPGEDRDLAAGEGLEDPEAQQKRNTTVKPSKAQNQEEARGERGEGRGERGEGSLARIRC